MAARDLSVSLLDALGLTRAQGRLYERVAQQTGRRLEDVAGALLSSPEQLRDDLVPLVAAQLVQLEDGRVQALPPVAVAARLLGQVADDATRVRDLLTDMAALLPRLSGTAPRATEREVDEIVRLDGEITTGGDVPVLLQRLLDHVPGDVRWFRSGVTDPTEEAVLAVVDANVARGRVSRAIYPLRAWQEHPDLVRARVAAGEDIRLATEVPTRMMLVGASHAMVTEPLGFHHEPRSLVRQRGLVEALGRWFELLWDGSLPVPAGEAGPGADLRRLLLEQLSSGAQDEQIARRLGISLRTVRRRVAEILAELGAETRFQAGVEAVRRGWL